MRKISLYAIIAISFLALFLIYLFISNQLSSKSKNNTDSQFSKKYLEVEIIASNLEIPWEITFLPNNEMLITERDGRLLRMGENKAVIEVEGVEHIGEGGLLGLALHPNFEENRFVYLYFTSSLNGNIENRVERYYLDLNNSIIKERKIILEKIPGAAYHDGGRIAFGPDKYLYITTGDAGNSDSAQRIDSLAGKILRIDDEGFVPADNPFGNAVYSYGHRNSQGLAWDEKGRLWATEHGRSGIQSGLDELNLIEKGRNYGWPIIQGDEIKTGMEKPIINSGTDETWAPAGAVYYNGNIFFAGLRGESLYVYDINNKKLKTYLKNKYGRLRAVVLSGDYLYITTSNRDGRGEPTEMDDKIIKINIKQFFAD